LRFSQYLLESKNWWGFEKASDDFAPLETFPVFLGFFWPNYHNTDQTLNLYQEKFLAKFIYEIN
jgi:hypothetical protein